VTATAQGTGTGGAAHAPIRVPSGRRRRHDLLFVLMGVVGELMITAGVLLGGFVVWQLWWTDVEGDRAQARVIEQLDWEPAPVAAPAPDPAAEPTVAERRTSEPPVPAEPPHATTFATMVVPRWTGEPERPISQGVDRATVLDPLGVGHYPGTAMPGAVGNFAVAAHRTTYGKPFHRVEELVVGDPVVVRTSDTWYVYRVTGTRIVAPSDVAVIAPNPDDPAAEPTLRTMTMTTCHPMFSARERYIVHATLDYWAPTSGPAPAELAGGA
jgi:sortase A